MTQMSWARLCVIAAVSVLMMSGADKTVQAQDLPAGTANEASLVSLHPAIQAAITDNATATAAMKAAQVATAKAMIDLIGDSGISEVFTALSGLGGEELVRRLIVENGALAEIGAEAASGFATSLAIEAGADIFTDWIFTTPPLRETHPRLRGPLKAMIRASLVETGNLISSGGKPTALLGMALDRAYDAIEIYNGARLLAGAERSALVASALSIASAAEIGVAIGGDRGDQLILWARNDLSETMPGAVGTDDAEVVESVYAHALDALVAFARKDITAARAAYMQMLASGRNGNITPFSAILNPLDWGVAAINLGRDSPEIALEVLHRVTAIAEIGSATSPTGLTPNGTGGELAADVNRAFAEAIAAYRAAIEMPIPDQALELHRVLEMFGKIISDHPDSRPALAIEAREVPGVDFTRLDEAALAVPPATIVPDGPEPDASGATGSTSGDENAPWSADIVAPDDVFPLVCHQDRTMECLLGQSGISVETARFMTAYSRDHEGLVVPIEFRELGRLDIVIGNTATSEGSVTLIVNGTPSILFPNAPSYDVSEIPESPALRRVQSAFPEMTGWRRDIIGYRKLPDGTLRFTTSNTFTEICRACPIVGRAIGFDDFDAQGTFIRYVDIGFLDTRGMPFTLPLTPDLLRSRPEFLQYALNQSGYEAGPMDGRPGPRTRRALMEFQAEHCLPATGEADDVTLASLAGDDTFVTPCFDEALPTAASVFATELSQCGPATLPMDRDGLVAAWEGREVSGTTESGATWLLSLSTLGQNDTGRAAFSSGGRQPAEGLWQTTATGLCQSYDGGSAWVCHDVLTCAADSGRYAMRNADGRVSSIVSAGAKETVALPMPAGLYAAEPKYCEMNLGELGEYSVATSGSIQWIERDGAWLSYETSCIPQRHSERDGILTMQMLCSGEGETWTRTRAVTRHSDAAYEDNGRRFTRCADPSEVLSTPILTPELSEPPVAAGQPETSEMSIFGVEVGEYAFSQGMCEEKGNSEFDGNATVYRSVRTDSADFTSGGTCEVLGVAQQPFNSLQIAYKCSNDSDIQIGVETWQIGSPTDFAVRVDDQEPLLFEKCVAHSTGQGTDAARSTLNQPATVGNLPYLSGDTELDRFMADSLPDWLVPSFIEYRAFPGEAGGRLSVAGSLKLKRPIVTLVDGLNGLAYEARMQGVENTEFLFHALTDTFGPSPERRMKEYVILFGAGSEIPFSAELPYIETVRSKQISGSIGYDMGGGVAEGSLDEKSYVDGSDKLKAIVAGARQKALDAQRDVQDATEAFADRFSNGMMLADNKGDVVFDIHFFSGVLTGAQSRARRAEGGSFFNPGDFAIYYRIQAVKTEHPSMSQIKAGTKIAGFAKLSISLGQPGLRNADLSIWQPEKNGRGLSGIATRMRWDPQAGETGAFVENRITSIGNVVWPR